MPLSDVLAGRPTGRAVDDGDRREEIVDGDAFDRVTKGWVGSLPRRPALRLLAGAAFAGVATRFGERNAAAGVGCRVRGRPCNLDLQCCTGNCRRGLCRPERS